MNALDAWTRPRAPTEDDMVLAACTALEYGLPFVGRELEIELSELVWTDEDLCPAALIALAYPEAFPEQANKVRRAIRHHIVMLAERSMP